MAATAKSIPWRKVETEYREHLLTVRQYEHVMRRWICIKTLWYF